MPILFLLFLLVPMIEIALFIELGGWIGLWPTLGLIVLTALIGSALVRHQGLATLARARAATDRGEMPLKEAATGVAILIAGLMLITPGFFTDTVGFLLLVPWVRRGLGVWLGARVIHAEGVRFGGPQPPGGGRHGPGRGGSGRGPIIDGDYQDVTPDGSRRGDGDAAPEVLPPPEDEAPRRGRSGRP